MTLRGALFRTMVSVLIVLFTFVYVGVLVPLDGRLTPRESLIAMGCLAVALVLLASSWLRFLWRLLRIRNLPENNVNQRNGRKRRRSEQETRVSQTNP